MPVYGPRCKKIRRALSLTLSTARATKNATVIALAEALLGIEPKRPKARRR